MHQFWKGRFSLKAIVLGSLADTTGSLLYGFRTTFFSTFAAQMRRNVSNIPRQVIHESYVQLFHNLVVGTAFTFLGGYIAARAARLSELKNSFGAGILSELTACAFVLTSSKRFTHLWYDIISLAVIIPAAVLGGYLRMREIPPQPGAHEK